MVVRGGLGSENFDYVKISVEGCDLGPECLNDSALGSTTVNFLTLKSQPSLLDDDVSELVSYNTDLTYFKFIDPTRTQATNLFFMKSHIVTKDNIIDASEKETPIFEAKSRFDY